MTIDNEAQPQGARPKISRATIRDVAMMAKVSVTTASRALNDTGRMTEHTRMRVRTAAEQLDYRPNPMARGLVQRRSFTLGLLTNDTYGRFTLPVAAGLSMAMMDRGVSVFLCAGENDPAREQLNLRAMEEKRVDGLVIAGKRIDRGLSIDLSSLDMPVVHVNAACPNGGVGFLPDDVGGAEMAVTHLIRLGRHSIAHVAGPRDFLAVLLREKGYFKALEKSGCEPFGEVIFGNWSEAHGFEAAHRLFAAHGPHPDAVFCGNDQIARGMIDAITIMGMRVPEDVAVVGFDNWEIFAAATRPALTSIDMGFHDLGKRAGFSLLSMIDGQSVERAVTKMPCRIVVRQSCGAT